MNKKKYITYKNKIIFKYDFNEPLNNYIGIISKYNYLMFSVYEDVNLTLINKNKFKFEDIDNYIGKNKNINLDSNFNQPIFFLPDSIHYLSLSFNFNNYINLPKNLIYLKFDSNFDNNINLHNKIKYLIFGHFYNQTIIKFPSDLTHLIFGGFFNKPLKNLPNTLTYLKLGLYFNQELILPQNLTHLFLEESFNLPFDLPNNIIFLEIQYNQINLIKNKKLNQFDKLSDLKIIGKNTNSTKLLLPSELQKLSYYDSNGLKNILPDKLVYLTLGYCYTEEIDLPENIKFIKFSGSNQYVLNSLPNSIEIIYIDEFFNSELNNLPNQVKKIIFNKNNIQNIELNSLPESIELIKLPRNYSLQINKFPLNLKKIICSKNYQFMKNIISKYKVVTY